MLGSVPGETRFTYCRICEAACGLAAELEEADLPLQRPDVGDGVDQEDVVRRLGQRVGQQRAVL